MAASEEAMGEGHPATFTKQPASKKHHGELSGEAFGEDQKGLDTDEIPTVKFDPTHE